MVTNRQHQSTAFSAINDPDLIRGDLFINGRWTKSCEADPFSVIDPATGTCLGTVEAAGVADVKSAIAAADRAWPIWRELTPDERGGYLRGWADSIRAAREDLARLMTLEQGKPLSESRAEIEYAASFLDWFAEEGRRAYGETIPSHLSGKWLMTVRQPTGIAAAITPWNFPAAMITRKAGAALAAGCPMIVRPASETPFSALALAELANRAGIPAGVLSVLPGDPETIAEILMQRHDVRAVSFTGSTGVGRTLFRQAADTVKRVSLELGGHAPLIVFPDVDLDNVVEQAVIAKFQTGGQDCLAANRIYVHREIQDAFVERFTARTEQLVVGNGFDEGAEIGPLISPAALERCRGHIRDALDRGARLCTGGNLHDAGKLFLRPTVLSEVGDEMLISREETFGPVAGISVFDEEPEVVARANSTHYGLAAYVFTRDLSRAVRLARAIESGMIAVNTARFTGAPIPFGGVKQSGLGREGSHYGLDEYSDLKYICIGLEEPAGVA